MAESNDSRCAQVRNLIEKGYEARYQGDPEISHQYFWDAQRLAEASQDGSALGDAWLALADNAMHFCPGDVDVSPLELRIEYCERALEYFRSCDDQQGISKCLRMLAVADDPALQEHRLMESLRIARELDWHLGIANTLRMMANTTLLRRDTAQALELLQEALTHAELSEDDGCIFEVHQLFSLALDDFAQRRPHLQTSLEICRRRGWTEHELKAIMDLEYWGCDPQDLATREAYLNEALPLARQPGREFSLGRVLCALAAIARERGNETLAAQLEAEANEVSPPIEIPPEFVEAIESGDVRSAIQSLFQAEGNEDQGAET